MKYKVTTYCYDNFRAEFGISPAADNEVSHTEAHPRYDLYVDVFNDYESAKVFYDECKAEEDLGQEDEEMEID